jgi:UPF0176 protein
VIMYKIVAFYKFVSVKSLLDEQSFLTDYFARNHSNIVGSVLIAHEGFNGTIAGTDEAIDAFCALLINRYGFENDDYKFSYATIKPFGEIRVRLKKEIVTLKQGDCDPTQKVGTYVEPSDWNSMIADDAVTILDVRNDFEVQVGSFQGAINPETTSFSDFSEYVDHNLDPEKNKKIAMFCTGGIRCEKASSYMLSKGFEEVYHLKGGILKYLEQVPQEESKWHGDCFVFDRRIAVKHDLTELTDPERRKEVLSLSGR